MKLYDDIINKCLNLLENTNMTTYKKKDISSWDIEDEQKIILRSDMAYELGGMMMPAVSALAFTSDIDFEDEVVVVGDDISEIKSDTPYARVTMLKIDDSEWTDNQKAYSAMQRIDYTRYHVYPKGFMMRISTSTSREPVRISRQEVDFGLNFAAVGGTFIDAYHKHKEVKAVKIIFITNKDFPYDKLAQYASSMEDITKSLDKIFNNLVMDCRSCNLKPVCDEVEGMRELHKRLEVK